MNDPIPEGPQGVWVEYQDGTRYVDVPTVYVGLDESGSSTFELIPPRDERPTAIGARLWPARTGLSVPLLQRRWNMS